MSSSTSSSALAQQCPLSSDGRRGRPLASLFSTALPVLRSEHADGMREEDLSLAVGGYAPALHFCPHVDAHIRQLPYGAEQKDVDPNDNVCCDCDNASENWLCLQCHAFRCGRFARGHARDHFTATGHSIACGLEDLSFWCYSCESYLHHLSMQPVFSLYQTLHLLKFGEETVEVTEFSRPAVVSITEEEEEEEQPLSLSAGLGVKTDIADSNRGREEKDIDSRGGGGGGLSDDAKEEKAPD